MLFLNVFNFWITLQLTFIMQFIYTISNIILFWIRHCDARNRIGFYTFHLFYAVWSSSSLCKEKGSFRDRMCNPSMRMRTCLIAISGNANNIALSIDSQRGLISHWAWTIKGGRHMRLHWDMRSFCSVLCKWCCIMYICWGRVGAAVAPAPRLSPLRPGSGQGRTWIWLSIHTRLRRFSPSTSVSSCI